MALRALLQRARSAPSAWIFLLAFAVRLLVLVPFSHSIHFLPESDDMQFYADWASKIGQGQFTDKKAFYGLPGYAFALAAIFFFTGGFDPFLVGLLQALMDAGIAVLIYRISCLAFSSDNDDGE